MMSRPVRLFLVEDNLADVWLIEECLKRNEIPYEIEHHATAEDAIHAAETLGVDRAAPDVMLIDLNLPRGHGIDVLDAASKNPALTRVPKAVLSSFLSPEEHTVVRSLGTRRVVHKPGSLDVFMTEVGAVIKELLNDAPGLVGAAP
jgi:CheY-like chemotaxis protein